MKISKLETIVILFLVAILILSIVFAPKGSYIDWNKDSGTTQEEVASLPQEIIPENGAENQNHQDTNIELDDISIPDEAIQETEIPEQIHLPNIPANIRITELDGRTYYDTGAVSEALRCGVLDGNVSVDGNDYGYQLSGENTIDVLIDDKWCIFEAEDVWGLKLTVCDVTNIGLTYVFTQSGGNPQGSLQYGSEYVIERLTDGTWTALDYQPHEYEIAWTAEAYIINNASETTADINWEWLYGKLPAGTYRFGKSVMDFISTGKSENKMYYAEFEIA